MSTLATCSFCVRNLLPPLTVLALLLGGCGGGGGGGASSSQSQGSSNSLASVSASAIPSTWPSSFKSATISQSTLVTATELAQTSKPSTAVFLQIWYQDQGGQRQTLAVMSMDALARLGGTLTLNSIPLAVTSLWSEVYTDNAGSQQTLATKEIQL